MIANVEPDGQINTGCYVKNRGTVNCSWCGFAAHTEISQAFQMHPGPMLSGMKIFKYRNLICLMTVISGIFPAGERSIAETIYNVCGRV